MTPYPLSGRSPPCWDSPRSPVIPPSIDKILRAYEDPDSHPEILAALRAGDSQVVETWKVLERIYGTLRGERPGAASLGVTRKLHDLAVRAAEAARESMRELLLADSVPLPEAALRGDAHSRFHELYQAGDYEVDLAWMDDESLLGQVLAPADAREVDRGVCILYGGHSPRQAEIERTGEFEFRAVPAGVFELAIETGEKLVVVPKVELQRR